MDTKEIISEASNAVNEIGILSASIKLGKDSSNKNLDRLIKVLGGSSLSKISSGLGAAGALISLVSLFSGAKSNAEIFKDMLTDIDNKIDSLQSLMVFKFEYQQGVIEKNTTLASLLSHISVIENARETIYLFLQATNTEQKRIKLGNIKKINCMEIRKAATAIGNVLGNSPLNNDLYNSTYTTSYGDTDEIQELGRALSYHLYIAQISDTLVNCVKDNIIPEEDLFQSKLPKDGEKIEIDKIYLDKSIGFIKDSEDYFERIIPKNTQRWKSCLEQCKKECADNIENFFKSSVSEKLIANDHKNSAKVIADELKAKWGWLDFFTIVYKPVKGDDNHAMSGLNDRKSACKGHFISFFGHQIKSTRVNIVIAWVDRENKENGSNRDTKVSFTYEEYKAVLRRGTWVKKDYKGNAGGFGDNFNSAVNKPKDLRCPLTSMVSSKPSSNRFVWIAKKKLTAWPAQSNDKRCLWADEKYLDVAIFE